MTSFSRSFWSLSFLKVTNGSRYKWLPRIKGRKWKALHLGRIYVLGSKVGIGFSQDWLSPSKLSIPSRPLFWNSSNHPDTFAGKIRKNKVKKNEMKTCVKLILFCLYFYSDLFWKGPRLNSMSRASVRNFWLIAYICGPSRVITWLVRGSVVSSYLLKSTDPREWSRDQKLSFLLRNWLKVAFRPGPPVKISFRKVNKQNWQSTEYGGTKRILFFVHCEFVF